MAMIPLMGIVAQPFWGQVADRTGSRARVLALLGLCAALGHMLLFAADGFALVLLATALVAFFGTALIPSSVSVTLALTGEQPGAHAFGRLRMWGTVGFLVVVVGFPPLLHAIQDRFALEAGPGVSEPGLGLMFFVTASFLIVGALAAFTIPGGGAMSLRASRGDWRQLLRHGPFLRFLAFALLAYLCLQGPMAMFALYVRAHGGSLDSVSQMWVLMLSLEIPLIFLSGASVERFGPRGLLAIGVIAGGIRWTVCGFVDDPFWVYAVQVLHGVVVAGLVIGGPLYVEAVVPQHLRSTGQGLLAMIGVSVGGIASNLASGWLLEHHGPNAPYVLGGVSALVLGCLIPVLIPPARRPDSQA
jgi:PPP family 3-phenylpropionic acid transporter